MMWGEGEDDTKGRVRPLTTNIYIVSEGLVGRLVVTIYRPTYLTTTPQKNNETFSGYFS